MKRALVFLRHVFSITLVAVFACAIHTPAIVRAAPAVQHTSALQEVLDQQPGPLKSYTEAGRSAADSIEAVASYYNISPRILVAMLEATTGALSDATVPATDLRAPFGASGPSGFTAQLDWAARHLRGHLGPYSQAPVVTFSDGMTATLRLDQAPEGLAVQQFLAEGRTNAEWVIVADRFVAAFERYFGNELPVQIAPSANSSQAFLSRPWPEGTQVEHLAYFDHTYPTVDTHSYDNGVVTTYQGIASVQYDGHDGHDYVFPDQPIGSHILAAADGVAYARTHRGNGVVIVHPNGYETVYWHLDEFATMFRGLVDTDRGVEVKAGDLIGSSGRSGFVGGTPHLHFEVRYQGKQIDPYGWSGSGIDPCTQYSSCLAGIWLWLPTLGDPVFTRPLEADLETATVPAQPLNFVLFLTFIQTGTSASSTDDIAKPLLRAE